MVVTWVHVRSFYRFDSCLWQFIYAIHPFQKLGPSNSKFFFNFLGILFDDAFVPSAKCVELFISHMFLMLAEAEGFEPSDDMRHLLLSRQV